MADIICPECRFHSMPGEEPQHNTKCPQAKPKPPTLFPPEFTKYVESALSHIAVSFSSAGQPQMTLALTELYKLWCAAAERAFEIAAETSPARSMAIGEVFRAAKKAEAEQEARRQSMTVNKHPPCDCGMPNRHEHKRACAYMVSLIGPPPADMVFHCKACLRPYSRVQGGSNFHCNHEAGCSFDDRKIESPSPIRIAHPTKEETNKPIAASFVYLDDEGVIRPSRGGIAPVGEAPAAQVMLDGIFQGSEKVDVTATWIEDGDGIPREVQVQTKSACRKHWTGGLSGRCPDCGER